MWLLIGLAGILNLLIMVPYGRERCINDLCGIFFGGIYRGHDEVWHMALAENSFFSFPFQTPLYAGAPLTGYHYLSSFLMTPFTLLGIPAWVAMYWALPIAWFALFALLSYRLARALHPTRGFVLAFLFFQFFAGSFNYLIRLRNYGNLWEHKTYLIHQSLQYLTNMPVAWSIIPVLALLLLMAQKPRTLRQGAYAAVLFFLGFGFKFYAGVSMVLLWGSYLLLSAVRKHILLSRIAFLGLPAALGAALGVIFFYNPLSSLSTGSIFSFVPFATTHLIIEDKDYFQLPDLVLQRYYLYEHGIGPRLIAIELLTLFLSVFFSFGTRIIGFFTIARSAVAKKITVFDMSLVVSLLSLIAGSALLVQKGDWFNTAQFSTYAMLLMNMFAARALYGIACLRPRWIAVVGVIAVVVFTVHNTLDVLNEYFLRPKYAYIPRREVEALTALSAMPRGVVFTLPHKTLQYFDSNIPGAVVMWQAVDSTYVAAYGKKPLWYADRGQLGVTGVDSAPREHIMKNLENANVQNINARYFYLTKGHPDYATMKQKLARVRVRAHVRVVFENEEVKLYSREAVQ